MYILRIKGFKIVHADTFYNYDDEYKTFEMTIISLLQNSFLYREKKKNKNRNSKRKTQKYKFDFVRFQYVIVID